MLHRPVALVILDGWGISKNTEGNALKTAKLENYSRLKAIYPNSCLDASGLAVGLPPGQMGNSEVGHLNIGAGRVVYQDFTRISQDIESKEFFSNPELVSAMKHVNKENTALHIIGLLSDGGVHSHITHLFALLDMAKLKQVKKVYLHMFLDGRDVPPKSAGTYIEQLEDKLKETGIGEIATISGRYYAMDRDKRWNRTQKAFDAMVLGEGEYASSAKEALHKSYDRDETDEFVIPTVIKKDGEPVGLVSENDAVIFLNFRPDRARQITRAIVDDDFNGFNRKPGWFPVFFVCMTEYDAKINGVRIAYKPVGLNNILGEVVSKAGLKQLRIAETEKYAHVTFFFNGGQEIPFPGEDRILIPSPKVATYDLKPEMSAIEVAETAALKIRSGQYDFIVLNFANPDMVGHTGRMAAAVKAVEAIDMCLGQVVDEIVKTGGAALVLSDHGNCEQMIDDEGRPQTAHTTNPVPFIVASQGNYKVNRGKLSDVAPTALYLLGIDKPAEMTGESLIKEE
jgi:2,3-bisphosphoglycerate-independent phosphoglycerate mutase